MPFELAVRSGGRAQLTPYPFVIAGAAAGLLAGSFIATAAVRFGTGESALVGRSRCDACAAPVPAYGLVPLFSYAFQGGKARCCGARIDPIHPVAEGAAAGIGALSTLLPAAYAIAAAWFGWLLLALALIDLRSFRLPNSIVLVLAASGVAASLILDTPSPTQSLIGILAGYGSLEAVRRLYRYARGRDGIGSGDPKMLAAIGAWAGWEPLPTILLLGAAAGLIWAGLAWLAGHPLSWSKRLPFGTLLGIAAWPVWLWWIAAPSV